MPDINTDFYPKQQQNSLLGTITQAAQASNLGMQNKLLGTENQKTQLDLLVQKQGVWNNMVSSLMADPEVSYDKVMQTGQQGVHLGFFGPDMLEKEAQIFSPNDTPQQIQQKLQVIATRGISGLDNLNRNAGTPTSVGTGSNTVFGNQSVNGFTPKSTVANAMTPGDANSPLTVTNADGSSTTTTKGAFAGNINGIHPLAGGGPQPAAGNPIEPAGAPGAQPGAPAPLPGITAPSPQQQKMFDASGEQYQMAKQNDANYAANLIPLQKMIELLPKTQTGLGAETTTNLAKVAQTFGINLPGTSTQADYYSQLEKYANVLARSSGAAPNSDAQLLAAMSSNPNVTMNNAAAQDVAKMMMSLQRMQHATIATAEAQNITPEKYSDYARQMGAQQDPRAYGVDLMSPEAKQALMKELASNPAAKAKFVNSLRIADQAGVLSPQGATSGQ